MESSANRPPPSCRWSRRLLWVAAVWCCALFACRADEPLVTDEVHFARVGRAAAETGRPIYAANHERPAQVGMWHPPTYIYLLAATVRLCGPSPIALRLPGLACLLLSAWLLHRFVRRVDDAADSRVPDMAVAVYLFSPLAAHFALLLDIDNTILTVAILAFLLLLQTRSEAPGGRDVLRAGLGLAACFAMKMTTPLLLLPAAFAHWWRRSGPARAALAAASMGVVGAGLFISLLWAYCESTGMPFDMPWHHNFAKHSQGARPHITSYGLLSGPLFLLIYKLWMAKNAALWLSPYLLLLALPATVRELVAGRPGTRAAILVAWGSLAGYTAVKIVTYSFPKYVSLTLPIAAWLAARTALASWDAVREAARPGIVAAGAAVLAAHLTFFGDPFPRLLATYRGAEKSVAAGIALYYFVPAAVGLAFFLWVGRRAGIRASDAAVLFLFAAWFSTSLSLGLRQSFAGYVTTYQYGERDLEQLSTRLARAVRPGDTPLVSIDMAELAGCDFLDATESTYKRPDFERLVSDPRVSAWAYRRRELDDPARYPFLEPIRARLFGTAETIGSFVLMRRLRAAVPPAQRAR